MEVKVKLRHLRIAPRKVRLIADLIRGKGAIEAQALLNFCKKRAALPVSKLLKSALANAKNNLNIEESNLFISKITVDEGPKLKRWRPRSRGQAFEIQKKTSHITLVLKEKEETKEKRTKKTKKAKESKPSSIREEKPEISKEKPEGVERSDKIAKKVKPKKEFQKPFTRKITPKMFRRKAF